VADNIQLSTNSGTGALLASDENNGAPNEHYQLVKLVHGGLNSFTIVSTSSGLPVQQQGTFTVSQGGAPWSENVTQLAGTAVDVNSGAKSAGTLRVVLATDQPALTNKLLVTPDSVALPANQSVNVSQINAVTALVGNGATGAGSQRVTIASDNTAFSVNANPVAVAPVLTTLQNAAVATGNGTVLSVAGHATAILNVTTSVAASGGTTLNFEASVDGTTFVSILGNLVGTNTLAVSGLNAAMVGDWEFNVAGYTQLRARISAYSAGTITVKGYPTTVSGAANVINANALVGGSTADGNSGNKSAQTLRVVLATDQPALTNKLLVTPDSVALPANQSVNVSQINAVTPLMGNGVTGTGSQRVTIASDNTAFTVNAAQSGTWTVQPGNTANTTPWLVSQVPTTAGGLSISRTLSAANTTGINAKGSAGQVYGWAITNTNASARFVKLYNKATAPTVGTDTPVITLVIPGNATGAGMVAAEFTSGIAFGTGIGYGITGAIADNDTTAPAANEVVVNLFFK
jgi:hypothetical protein